MIALNRSRIVTSYTDTTAEAVFLVDVSDGKRYEVKVEVEHGGERGGRYVSGLVMAVWARIEDYGWEGGITYPTPNMKLTITEVR